MSVADEYKHQRDLLQEQISTKDAEIAELRAAIARQASAVRTLHWAKNEMASGQLRQAHELQRQSKPEALASERDANQQLTDALEKAESERDEARQEREKLSHRLGQCVLQRDEARECVGRLYSAAIDVVAVAGLETLIFDTMREAIAATPEHLRK